MQQPSNGAATSVSGFSAKEGRRHFQTFDALRFFAFFKVFLLHLPVFAFPWFNYLRAGGGIGVQFFFVLSGFLITYIIADEKQRTGTLNLRNFFVRRILRIWPLYYLMVLVAYSTPYILEHFLHLSASADGYEPELWMSLLFLENYKMMAMHDFANVSPLSVMWSLCIEEHFYIVWGILLALMNTRHLPAIIGVCLVVSPVFRIVYVGYDIPTSDLFTNIDLFAYGAIPAWLWVHHQSKTERIVSNISLWAKMLFTALLVLTVFLCSQLKGDAAFIFVTCLLGLLFAVLIALTLPEVNRYKISDRSWVSVLGVYTYGLYLYHTLVISFLRKMFARGGWVLDEPMTAAVFIAIALILTIIISWLSYHLFEKPFLKLKTYFR